MTTSPKSRPQRATRPDRVNVKMSPRLQELLELAAEERLIGRDRLLEVLLLDGLSRLVPLDELRLIRPATNLTAPAQDASGDPVEATE